MIQSWKLFNKLRSKDQLPLNWLSIKTKNELRSECGQLVGMLWRQTLGDESETIKFCHLGRQIWSPQCKPSFRIVQVCVFKANFEYLFHRFYFWIWQDVVLVETDGSKYFDRLWSFIIWFRKIKLLIKKRNRVSIPLLVQVNWKQKEPKPETLLKKTSRFCLAFSKYFAHTFHWLYYSNCNQIQ